MFYITGKIKDLFSSNGNNFTAIVADTGHFLAFSTVIYLVAVDVRIIIRAAWKGRRRERERQRARFRSFLHGERGHRLRFYAAMKLSLG